MNEAVQPTGRLAAVKAEIAAACREAGRDPASVTLVAISKTFGADAIEPVIAAGQRVFGENRVQEAKAKWPALKARYPDVALHLVGPLQSNKAKDALALFDQVERQPNAEYIPDPGRLALHRCRRWVHSSNGYRCDHCGPLNLTTRTCKTCGTETTSASRYVCAGCHFAGWWRTWA